MSRASAILFWATAVIYALTVGAQLFGQVFRRPAWVSRALLGIVCGLALGYADAEHPANRARTERIGLDEFFRVVG